MMRRIVKLAIGKNTFEVSYTGRVGWSGMDKHLTCFTPYIDMNLSGGLSVEIFSLGEYFDINIMQRTYDRKYVDRIVELLAELGINCEMNEPEPFSISRFQLLL